MSERKKIEDYYRDAVVKGLMYATPCYDFNFAFAGLLKSKKNKW